MGETHSAMAWLASGLHASLFADVLSVQLASFQRVKKCRSNYCCVEFVFGTIFIMLRPNTGVKTTISGCGSLASLTE